MKHDENWKAFGACKVLNSCVKVYQVTYDELTIERKKDEESNIDDEGERSKAIGLEIRCDHLQTRIQYLFNFIMNYRSRYAHQLRTKQNKFLLEEH